MTSSQASEMGKKGAEARAKTLSPQRRSEIALRAAQARWKGHKSKKRSNAKVK